MSKNSGTIPHRYREGIVSAVSVGFFFILAGTIFVTTPNLLENVTDFFQRFETVLVPNTEVYLPAPILPGNYMTTYRAVGLFSLIWAFFQIATLIIRILAGSPLRKKVENVSDVAFWLGAYYLIETRLTMTYLAGPFPLREWFAFWTLIVVLVGVTFLVRATLFAAMALRRR